MDTRLKTLESTIDNKALLLRGLPATGFAMNNLDWNILLHEEQGPRVALGLSRAIQQLFHHYQTDTGSPQMYIDATISLYVDQYPPVRLQSG